MRVATRPASSFSKRASSGMSFASYVESKYLPKHRIERFHQHRVSFQRLRLVLGQEHLLQVLSTNLRAPASSRFCVVWDAP
eukprot:4556821-Prymnesium_polylepis.2